MDLNEAGAGQPGRTEAFTQGSAGMPYRVASSMSQNSAKWNDSVGSTFTPHSVLNSLAQSSNGMSSRDYSRVLPGGVVLDSPNGQADSTYRQAVQMRMLGKPY